MFVLLIIFSKTVFAASSGFVSFRVVFAISLLLCITSRKDPSTIELKIEVLRYSAKGSHAPSTKSFGSLQLCLRKLFYLAIGIMLFDFLVYF